MYDILSPTDDYQTISIVARLMCGTLADTPYVGQMIGIYNSLACDICTHTISFRCEAFRTFFGCYFLFHLFFIADSYAFDHSALATEVSLVENDDACVTGPFFLSILCLVFIFWIVNCDSQLVNRNVLGYISCIWNMIHQLLIIFTRMWVSLIHRTVQSTVRSPLCQMPK